MTGGAGYIGSLLVPALIDRFPKVTVLDTFASGDTQLANCCASRAFEPVRGDARDERLLDQLVPNFDVIIPLAALVGAPMCARDPIAATSINRDAVLAIIKRMSSSQRLIYPTTNSGYGIGESDAYCTEKTPLRPISLYGRT